MPETETPFPRSIDINPTAKCNLRCTFCWGPDHDIPDGLTGAEWCELLRYFYQKGTRSVVFTGGEPLIRNDVPEIIRSANEIGYQVTLSTNGILLDSKIAEIGPFIHQIGLPIDGPDFQTNSLMRIGAGGKRSFAAAIEAMKTTRKFSQEIEITVRTVVSKVNCEVVPEIAATLELNSDYWDRWKIYQFAPAGIGESHRQEHEIDGEEFDRVYEKVANGFPGKQIRAQRVEDRDGRYFFVGPEGDFFTSGDTSGYRRLGAWSDLKAGEADRGNLLRRAFDYEKNSWHGV